MRVSSELRHAKEPVANEDIGSLYQGMHDSVDYELEGTRIIPPPLGYPDELVRKKDAVVTFDDAKTNIKALEDATFEAGYPSTVQEEKVK